MLLLLDAGVSATAGADLALARSGDRVGRGTMLHAAARRGWAGAIRRLLQAGERGCEAAGSLLLPSPRRGAKPWMPPGRQFFSSALTCPPRPWSSLPRPPRPRRVQP